ncbi:MAG: hypothetical protein JWM53_157 [bacterium]|nr:hypothetical protein [bacterium]
MVRETCVRTTAQLHANAVEGLRRTMINAVAGEAARHPKRVRAGVDRIVVTIPRGASCLFRSRPRKPDGKTGDGRRDFHAACFALLELYARVAAPPDTRGWRLVTGHTHKYFSTTLDYTVRRVQQFHNMLCAMGLVENDGEEDCGDEPKAWTDSKGRPRSVPRRRRRFWIKPARDTELAETVAAIVGSDELPPPKPSNFSRSGNQFPTDSESNYLSRKVLIDPVSPEYPQNSSHASRAFDLCAFSNGKPLPIDTSEGEKKEAAAVAAPIDQVSSTSPPPSTSTPTASPERPSAAQRGGSFASSGPAELDAKRVAPLIAAAVAVAAASAVDSEPVAGVPERPAVASVPRGWPGGAPRAGRVPKGQPIPFHAVPYPAAGHKATCDCEPCWVARAVSSGGLELPPHGRGSQCGPECIDCEAWRSVRDVAYRRFVQQARRAPTVRWAKNRRAASSAESSAAPPTASYEAVPTPKPAPAPVKPSDAGAAIAPLYPDNLSPDDIACGRAHVELAIRNGLAPLPAPAPDGAMPAKVRMHWSKLKAARRKAQATAYLELYTEACELPKLRRLRPDAPPTATYRELVELERAERSRARWRRHRDDCAGCPDCRHDRAWQLLDVRPHEPLCPAGLCPDCDLAFELFTMTPTATR